MTSGIIKVLLVDDSSFMRLVLTDILNVDPDIKVIGTAGDGKEAVEKTIQLRPDVVLMDIIMPEYDGLYAVKNIMQQCPTPILILSSLGNTNLQVVFESIEYGAFDFLTKPTSALGSKIRGIETQLLHKLKEAAKVDLRLLSKKNINTNTNAHTFSDVLPYDILAIGSSTGGTGALEEILLKLPSNFPIPIVIAQHMPPDFVHSFAKRLNEIMPFTVKVPKRGEELKKGVVYIMEGAVNTMLVSDGHKVRFDHTEELFQEFNHPSVDCLFRSVARIFGSRSIAAILTGMGKDGAAGLLEIHKGGGFTLAQDQSSSVVFGMPKAAIERGAVRMVLPLRDIPGYVVSSLS